MCGDEIITIYIESKSLKKGATTRYSLLQADRFIGSKEEYHLLLLDHLVAQYKKNIKNDNTKTN